MNLELKHSNAQIGIGKFLASTVEVKSVGLDEITGKRIKMEKKEMD